MIIFDILRQEKIECCWMMSGEEYHDSEYFHPMSPGFLTRGKYYIFYRNDDYIGCIYPNQYSAYAMIDCTDEESEKLWNSGYRMINLDEPIRNMC